MTYINPFLALRFEATREPASAAGGGVHKAKPTTKRRHGLYDGDKNEKQKAQARALKASMASTWRDNTALRTQKITEFKTLASSTYPSLPPYEATKARDKSNSIRGAKI